MLVMDDEGQVKRVMVRPRKGLEGAIDGRCHGGSESHEILPVPMSVAQQAQIEPRVPWMGPVAMEACSVIQMGPRYDVPFLKQNKRQTRFCRR